MGEQPKLTNLEAEGAVLASLLLDDSWLLEIKKILSVSDFSLEQHQRIFKAILETKGLDEITVAQKMRDQGTLQKHDCAYLAEMIAKLPTSVHCRYYADIVKDLSLRRQGVAKAGEMAGRAYEGKLSKVRTFNIKAKQQ